MSAAPHRPQRMGAAAPTPQVPMWQARWRALAPREQTLVLAAAMLVAAALLWWLALAPALRTLREAPARHAELDAQLERVQALAAQAQQLQAEASTRPTQAQAQRALQAATTSLGASARMNFVGDRATARLQSLPAGALAPWLAQARSNARSVPVEAHLARSAGNASGAAATSEPRWDGSIVLSLPAQ